MLNADIYKDESFFSFCFFYFIVLCIYACTVYMCIFRSFTTLNSIAHVCVCDIEHFDTISVRIHVSICSLYKQKYGTELADTHLHGSKHKPFKPRCFFPLYCVWVSVYFFFAQETKVKKNQKEVG